MYKHTHTHTHTHTERKGEGFGVGRWEEIHDVKVGTNVTWLVQYGIYDH